MSVIEHWIAYDVKREIGPTILREKWRADLFRADERNRVDGPFVPAEQLAGAVKALEQIAGHFLPGDERRTYAGPTDTLDMIRAEARDALNRLGGQ
jgi:hypothetical protein